MKSLPRRVCPWLPGLLPVLALVLAFAAGCASTPDDSRSSISLAGDFSTPFQIQIDNFVRRQPPAVYVSPLGPAGHRPRALFVPLRAVQQITNAVTFSDLLSRQVWQIWLSLNAFEALEYAPEAGPFERSRALALARQRGAELLVGGYINHYMDGGSGGDSKGQLKRRLSKLSREPGDGSGPEAVASEGHCQRSETCRDSEGNAILRK